MNSELKNLLSAALWKDIEEESSFPNIRPLLARYTSIANLEQIMGSDEIWFSNPLYMNDFEELRFGMQEGALAFRTSVEIRNSCGTQEVYERLIHHFNYLFDEFDQKHAFNTYVLCLTEHPPNNSDGLLSMWRGYGAGGSGAAIVFDSSKFQVNESSPLIVSKVIYASREERLKWIEKKIGAVAEVISSASTTDDNLFHIAHYWIERLKVFSLFTKHDGFHEEREWRVVYLSDRDSSKSFNSMLSYAITNRGIEPKLKLKVRPLEGVLSNDLSLEKIIHCIILGPTTSTFLAANSVKRMLQQKNKGALADKVLPSLIPFRP